MWGRLTRRWRGTCGPAARIGLRGDLEELARTRCGA